MRAVAIPVLCLFLLTGFAVMPTASAAPPDECNGTIGGGPTVGPVTVFVSPPCYDVYVDAMSCPLGNGEWTDYQVQTLGVHVYTCSQDPTASAAPPCTCPPPPMACRPVTTVGPLSEIVSVTVTSDCRVIVAILPRLIACSDPLDGAKAITVGKVTVWLPCGELSACEPPLECYPASAELPDLSSPASQPGPCGVQQRCPAPVPLCYQVNRIFAESPYYSLSDDCHVTVNLEAYCGLQGTDYHSVTVAKLTVNYQTCQSPPPPQSASMADPFPTCVRECSPVPTDSCELREATPTTVGPFLLPFNPQQFVWGDDCTIDAEPSYECVGAWGEDSHVAAAFVDVTVRRCGQPLPDIQ